MDNKEKIILESINREFRREALNTELPRSLSTESITAMLKSAQANQVADIRPLSPVDEKRRKTERAMAAVKSIISVAAAVVLIVMTALLFNARREISVLTRQNNLAGEEMSPEKIEFHILNELKKTVSKKTDTQGTKASEKNGQASKGEKNDGSTEPETNPEPTTLTAEQEIPSAKIAGALPVLPDTEFAVTDGSYIYRCIGIDSVSYIDIVSLSTLERVGENPVRLGGRCDEISICNNVLTAVYKNHDSGVLIKFFDVSNKAAPALVREYYQKGSCEFLSLSGGKICLATRTNGNPPDYSVNGAEGSADDSVLEIHETSPYYTIISVTDADNLNSDFVRAKVHGKLGCFSFSRSDLYASCTYDDAQTGETLSDVCVFALDGNGLTLSESHTVHGRVSDMAVMNDGVTAAVISAGRSNNLALIKPGGGEFGGAEDFCPGEVREVYALDGRVAVRGTSGMYIVKYNSSGEITVTASETAFTDGCKIFESDALLVSESAPDSHGKSAWTVAGKNGSMVSFNLDSKSITSDTGREMIVSGSGVCAVPVTISGRKGYLLFNTAGSGVFSSYPAPYVYDGTGKDICLISGDSFYVVSANRVTAVSVSEILEK